MAFAIPEHPWVDSADGAAVRVAMTIGVPGNVQGVLKKVVREVDSPSDEAAVVSLATQTGKLFADLSTGADVVGAGPLKANLNLSNRGVFLGGMGFVLDANELESMGVGRRIGIQRHIKQFVRGRDLTGQRRDCSVIDLYVLQAEEVRSAYPGVYQRVLETVKPERDQNNRESRKRNWWLFSEVISIFRPALKGLGYFIVTPRTAKHPFFTTLQAETLFEGEVIGIALGCLRVQHPLERTVVLRRPRGRRYFSTILGLVF